MNNSVAWPHLHEGAVLLHTKNTNTFLPSLLPPSRPWLASKQEPGPTLMKEQCSCTSGMPTIPFPALSSPPPLTLVTVALCMTHLHETAVLLHAENVNTSLPSVLPPSS